MIDTALWAGAEEKGKEMSIFAHSVCCLYLVLHSLIYSLLEIHFYNISAEDQGQLFTQGHMDR